MSKHTPGPLSVRIQPKWPFNIETVNSGGDVVFQDRMPCNSSRDRTPADAISCVHFDSDMRAECAAANERAVADAILRAAAPELLEALEGLLSVVEQHDTPLSDPERIAARAAIAKASGL